MQIIVLSMMEYQSRFIAIYTTVLIIFVSHGVHCLGENILRVEENKLNSYLIDDFNDYVDQVIQLLNSNQDSQSFPLSNHFTRGTWGYLLINVDYSLRLYNGLIEGIQKLQRTGDSYINYERDTGYLTIIVHVLFPQAKVKYNVEVNMYGFSHYDVITSSLADINITVALNINAANLQVTLDSITSNMTQVPTVTFQRNNSVVAYFTPSISTLPAISNLQVESIARQVILDCVQTLNDPNFGYY